MLSFALFLSIQYILGHFFKSRSQLFATATHQWSSSHIFRCIIAYGKTGDSCYSLLFVHTSGVVHFLITIGSYVKRWCSVAVANQNTKSRFLQSKNPNFYAFFCIFTIFTGTKPPYARNTCITMKILYFWVSVCYSSITVKPSEEKCLMFYLWYEKRCFRSKKSKKSVKNFEKTTLDQ